MDFYGMDFAEMKEKIEIWREKVNKATPILEKRYEKCDSKEHKDANEDSGLCDYCHRRLNYESGTGAIMEERKKLPWYDQSMDAPDLREKGMAKIRMQESDDWSEGLRKIVDEFGF